MPRSWLTTAVVASGLTLCAAGALAQGDQNLLTQLVGSPVEDSAGVPVGVVQDLLIDQGRAAALVVGLSGSLGVGEKDVAVAFPGVAAIARDTREAAEHGVRAAGEEPLRVRLKVSLTSLVAAPAFRAGSGPSALSPSSSSGVPAGVTKEPKSSTKSGGPG
ncbi:hypothetical protein SLNSH_06120 [Alsobacter soli]|uniref:PRC-barrel domain-containing protein n=1 Tax=Alsobacter soli TaxID=2109933 RepID=A0A2T1HWI1_9HYPH|nr:hypothetical protein SLNSH_06120 [Alsobacter soli]